MSFWQELKTPIVGLSPMDGVTDEAMRHISAIYGQPSVIFTEFVNVDGIVNAFKRLKEDFVYDEVERPIIAQLFGSKPANFYAATQKVIEMGFKIGIGGVVTFKNAKLADVVKEINLEDILLETDSPYLSPTPYRGKRNESSYIIKVLDKLAEIYKISPQEIAKITTQNSKNIFKI